MGLMSEVRMYERRTNMSVSDLKRWSRSQAFKEYVKKSGGDPREAVKRNIRLQKRISNGNISEKDLPALQKANSFLARAKADDKGQTVIGSGRTAVSKNTAALRSWGFDPTSRYT